MNSKTKALGFMVMDEFWSTSGAMVGEADVKIPAVSLTRPEIKIKSHLSFWVLRNFRNTESSTPVAMQQLLGGS